MTPSDFEWLAVWVLAMCSSFITFGMWFRIQKYREALRELADAWNDAAPSEGAPWPSWEGTDDRVRMGRLKRAHTEARRVLGWPDRRDAPDPNVIIEGDHRCQPPACKEWPAGQWFIGSSPPRRYPPGTVWRCGCGRAWEVDYIRGGLSWGWVRSREHDIYSVST